MNKIHPTAIISPNAVLGDGVEVGPYAYIDENVTIGDGCKIHPHAVIFSYVKIGKDCEVFPGAEVSYVEIGDNVTIRECATINRGTKVSGKGVTRIGDHTLIMSYVHVAHDCSIGNHCILTSYVGLAGETDVEDWAIIGGGTVAHQFSHVGMHAMVGGGFRISKDIPPYTLCGREPICYVGVNIVGLRRRGFDSDVIRNIKDIYDTIYFQGNNISDGCARARHSPPRRHPRERSRLVTPCCSPRHISRRSSILPR